MLVRELDVSFGRQLQAAAGVALYLCQEKRRDGAAPAGSLGCEAGKLRQRWNYVWEHRQLACCCVQGLAVALNYI